MNKNGQKVPRGVVFFSGYHGVGKTYTANALSEIFNAKIVDCGPIIRESFVHSGFNSFGGWAKNMERRLGSRWDDEILLGKIKEQIGMEDFLFVVGNRDIDTIQFLSTKLPHRLQPIIIYLDKPIFIMKQGYELRTKTVLTDKEFEDILHAGPDSKLETVREYVTSHPDHCLLIHEDGYSDYTTKTAANFINQMYG